MSEPEHSALSAQIRALHEDILEVKELAKATNGRVRQLEIWRASVQALMQVRVAALTTGRGVGLVVLSAIITLWLNQIFHI